MREINFGWLLWNLFVFVFISFFQIRVRRHSIFWTLLLVFNKKASHYDHSIILTKSLNLGKPQKKLVFIVVGPLRGGGVNPRTNKGKTTFFKALQKSSYDH